MYVRRVLIKKEREAYEDIITQNKMKKNMDINAKGGDAATNPQRSSSIDRAAQNVTLTVVTVSYDQLVIANRFQIPSLFASGHDLDGVLTYRETWMDVGAHDLGCPKPWSRAVVIGGGLPGL